MNELTDLDYALLCYSSYYSPADFDTYETGNNSDGVRYGVKRYPDRVVVCFEGTDSLLDVRRDLEADMIDDPNLGLVHRGFLIGMSKVLALVLPGLNRPGSPKVPITITGHSLGGARAIIFGTILQASKAYDVTVVAFEPPMAGGPQLKTLLEGAIVRLYHNGADPICNVPVPLPHMPYAHPAPLIPLNCVAIAGDPWLFLRDHRMLYVIVGITRLLGGFHA